MHAVLNLPPEVVSAIRAQLNMGDETTDLELLETFILLEMGMVDADINLVWTSGGR
jgi:hypothetical protein